MGSGQHFERLIRALQEGDLETFAAMLDPEVEVVGYKGTFSGPDAAIGWATPTPEGELYARVVADEVREVGEEYVAAGGRRQWLWRESDELAEELQFGALSRFRGGKLLLLRVNFPSIVDALDAMPAERSNERAR